MNIGSPFIYLGFLSFFSMFYTLNKFYIFFVKFIPEYFILFDDIINGIFFISHLFIASV